MRQNKIGLETKIKDAIESGNNPYVVKENYIAKHSDIHWWADHMNHVIYEETYRIMGDCIADFGCNHGLNTILLGKRASYAKITGIDRSDPAIEKAIENSRTFDSKNVNFILHELDNISTIDDNYFTGGYMTDVIEHIYPDDRKDIFCEIRRTLKDGAHLMIVTPYDKEQWGDIHHVDFFDEIKIKNILMENNWFDILYIQHDMRYNLRGKKMNRLNVLLRIIK